MTRSFLILVATSMLLITTGAFAQPSWQWGRTCTGVGESWPVATDKAGNVFAGGSNYSGGPSVFGSVTAPASSFGNQAVWVKYNDSGVPLWADGAIGGTWLNDITTDTAGNLILFGRFNGDSMRIGAFTLINAYGTGNQYFVAKVNPAGTVLWAVRDGLPYSSYLSDLFIGGTINCQGSVATDDSGNVYIASTYKVASMTIGAYILTNVDVTGATSDIFIAKYSPSGSLVWARSAGGTANDYVFGVTVSSSGFFYLTGGFKSSTITFGGSVLSNAYSKPRAYVAKYTAAGVPLWAQSAGGSRGAYGAGITHDGAGNLYMTGSFADTAITFGATTLTRLYPSSVPADATFLVKYDGSGAIAWGRTLSSPGGVTAFSVAYSRCGKVWVDGSADTTGTSGVDPMFIAGFDLSGTLTNYAGIGGGGDDQGKIACDAAGNVYLCDDFEGTLTVGPDVLTSTGSPLEPFYLAKFGYAPDTIHTHHDTAWCGMGSITLTAPAGYNSYYWSDGATTQSRTVSSTGDYIVYALACGDSVLADTLHVSLLPDTAYFHQDTSICSSGDAGASVTLTAPPGTRYHWYNGDTLATNIVNSTGVYWVYFHNACSISFDTFHVFINPIPAAISGPGHLCQGDTARYTDVSPGGHWHSSAPAMATIDSLTGLATAISAGAATISYILPTGCAISKTVNVLAPPCVSGVATIVSGREVIIAPNPASDELMIEADNNVYRSFVITNTMGEVCMRQELTGQETRAGLHLLPAGLYYITLSGEQGNVVSKFVKL